MYFLSTVLLILSSILLQITITTACKGCVNLDELNFEKIISKFPVVLVKFDVAYPYGEKHEIFSKFSEETSSMKDILFAEVGVKDYGEKENENLAKKYDITKDDYPTVKLFKKDVNKHVSFSKSNEFTLDNLRTFVRDNTNIYIGLPGCLEKYDKIASEFVLSDKKTMVLEEAELFAETLNTEEKNSAKTYIVIMKKIIDMGKDFLVQEFQRVNKLLQGKISPKKKAELLTKLNIIRAFNIPQKEEL